MPSEPLSDAEIAELRRGATGGDASDFGEAVSAKILRLLDEVARFRRPLPRAVVASDCERCGGGTVYNPENHRWHNTLCDGNGLTDWLR